MDIQIKVHKKRLYKGKYAKDGTYFLCVSVIFMGKRMTGARHVLANRTQEVEQMIADEILNDIVTQYNLPESIKRNS